MDDWFSDVGRTILLEGLGEVCDRINSSFKSDLQSHTQDKVNLVAQLETLRPLASRVQRLQEENTALKDEINSLKDASCGPSHSPGGASHKKAQPTVRPTDQISSERTDEIDFEAIKPEELKTKFLRMEKKHAKLHDRFLDLQAALHKSNELARERTDTCRRWIDHAKQLNEQSLKRSLRIKKLEARLAEISQEPLNLSFSSDDGDTEVAVGPATLTPIPPLQSIQSNGHQQTIATVSRHQTEPLGRIEDDETVGSPSLPSSIPESACPGSAPEMDHLRETDDITPSLPPLPANRESTEGGLRIKLEPSSDTPVVVSERRIRKRKNISGDESGIPASARVKIEHCPESLGIDKHRHFTPQESIDFDTGYRLVETPRKHTRYQHTRNVRLDKEISVQELAHDNRIEHSAEHIKHNSMTLRDDVSGRDLDVLSRAQPQANTSSALQPRNNNQILVPKSDLASSSRSRKYSTMPRGIAHLAEDSYQDENLNPLTSKNVPKVSALEGLLNTPSSKQNDTAALINHPAEDGQPPNDYTRLPKRRALPFGGNGRKSLGSTSKESANNSSREKTAPSVNQDDEAIKKTERRKKGAPALRQTPKARLRLDDFKVNPDANEGYDYAFTDVVRGKDERACLQGCVKENCCGHKFRALALAYRAGTRPHEFQTLLEAYLGDDCHQLSSMSEAEKETLWVEAKTRELANANGRHRHRYPRMSTPPGFWTLDFPNTQEGEEYNAEAAKLEREIVEERYREAMRPGGRWVFRDE